LPLGAGNNEEYVYVPLECPYGNYTSTYKFGINPSNMVPNNYCNVTNDMAINNTECTNFLNEGYVNSQIEKRNKTTEMVEL